MGKVLKVREVGDPVLGMKCSEINKSKIDLHIHTNCSDGKFTPKEIIDEAVKNGVEVISITDHDTVKAYTDEFFNYANLKKIKIVTGVEISTKIEKAGIHILGYNIDINNKFLIDKLFLLRNSRHIYLKEVGDKLKKLGYVVNVDKLDKIDAVTKAHIAQDIVENLENKSKLLKEFNHIPAKGEFIEEIMNEGCIAYVKKQTITPKEAADLIRQVGGKVVLAHPVAYKYEDGLTEKDIENIVENIKPDGIEANYIYVDRNKNKINEIEFWNNFAKKHNLEITTGSDFHNKDGVHPEIGLRNAQ